MTVVLSNPSFDDAARREHLHRGDVPVYGAGPASLALVDFTRGLVEEAFGDLDPQTAQHVMDVHDFAALLADLKPRFIHHPRCKELLPAILSERGCDLERTYFDVPRLRTSTSDDYLTTGIAFAFHPHRDTWYSAPLCQTNWWMPVYPVSADNVMAFHPRYMTRGIANGSRRYDYVEWNRVSRFSAASQIGRDTRDQPTPEEPVELDPQVRIVPEVGGLMLFSGNQLHSSVPNTSGRTRFSIDFRIVDIDDVARGRGSTNVDAACRGPPCAISCAPRPRPDAGGPRGRLRRGRRPGSRPLTTPAARRRSPGRERRIGHPTLGRMAAPTTSFGAVVPTGGAVAPPPPGRHVHAVRAGGETGRDPARQVTEPVPVVRGPWPFAADPVVAPPRPRPVPPPPPAHPAPPPGPARSRDPIHYDPVPGAPRRRTAAVWGPPSPALAAAGR